MANRPSRNTSGVIPDAFARLAPWCLIALIVAPAQSQPKYQLIDLGTLGGGACCTSAYGINRYGQAVGDSAPADGNFSKAFRTGPNAVIKPTDNLGGSAYGSSANAINSLGQVAGWVGIENSGIRAIRGGPNSAYDPATAFGTFGGRDSEAYGINDIGQVVGYALDTYTSRAFRTGPNLPFNPATDGLDDWTFGSTAQAINNSGQVVGTAYLGPTTDVGYHPFRVEPNTRLTPADLLPVIGYGWGINEFGQVTGWFYTPDGRARAFRTTRGAPINAPPEDLGDLGGGIAAGEGINSAGDVVGVSFIPGGGAGHAFIYTNGKMWDLNDLIPPQSGWVLQGGMAINDAGQIVGNGRFMDASRAFRLDPISACSLPAIDGASASPNQLWPANGKFVDVTVNYSVTSACASTCTLSVTSSEPGPNQSAVVDAHHVQLLAKRDGTGNGRVYTVTIACSNSAGSTTGAVTVLVPHDQGH
jgi:probable HAF family extracellular repeat protein